jgi:hypothetical protein
MRSVNLIIISIFACVTTGCGFCFSQADCPGMHSIDVVTADGAVVTNFAGRVTVDGTNEGFDVACQSGMYEPNTNYACSTNTLQLRHIEGPITVTLQTEDGSKRAEATYTLSIDAADDTCSCDTLSSYTLTLE